MENVISKHSKHLFLTLAKLQNRFLKSFLWENFDLKSFQCFASFSQKTISTSSHKTLQKNEKYHFKRLKTFVFFFKIASKPFYKMLHMPKFGFKRLRFQFRYSKFSKKLKNAIFKVSEHMFLTSRKLQNNFLKSFLWKICIQIVFNALPHFPRKLFQLRQSKVSKKLKKYHFQRFRTFVFDLKVASKSFSKMLLIPKFWFEQFLTLFLTFPENGFNFDT